MGQKVLRAGGPNWWHRSAVAALTATVLLLVGAPSASGSVTIGQVGPPVGCAPDNDWAQLTVTSGTSYVVPETGSLTSWSTVANAMAGMSMSMKVFRPAGGTNYTVVGHAGSENLDQGHLNTFPASVPVKPGDLLGLHSVTNGVGCVLAGAGDSYLNGFGDAADGSEVNFPITYPDNRLNISALLEPLNDFTVGKTTRNKKKGTATVKLDLPNPGELAASGGGLKISSATTKSVAAGTASLRIRAKGLNSRKLKATGKVKVTVVVTYTPANGLPKSRQVKVKLRKKL
jgi:hypothetical protein